MKPNDQPAFPVTLEIRDEASLRGLTKLEWFAGRIVTGYMTIPDERTRPKDTSEDEWRIQIMKTDAKYVFDLAEAMLAEAEKRAGK